MAQFAKGAVSEIDLKFRFTSNRLCLDLVSTVGEIGHRNIERLKDVRDLERWIVEAQLIDDPIEVNNEGLERIKRLRAALTSVFSGLAKGEIPAQEALNEINGAAVHEPVALQINADGRHMRRIPVHGCASIASVIARDAIELLASGQESRIRSCEEPTCNMLFLDTSRTANRRWCGMGAIGVGNPCGNKAKKRAYLERHKARADVKDD